MKTIKIKQLIILLLFPVLIFSCNSTSNDSTSKKCSDMDSYNKGFKEGKNNNMAADCDYYWEMDKNDVSSKTCFCKGFRDGGGEDWMK